MDTSKNVPGVNQVPVNVYINKEGKYEDMNIKGVLSTAPVEHGITKVFTYICVSAILLSWTAFLVALAIKLTLRLF